VNSVLIVDTGAANTGSVVVALQRLGARARISTDATQIRRAARVILPGVGAADAALQRLRCAGLLDLLAALDQPLLGICLGMQLLCQGSDEGAGQGLGIFPGRARAFPASSQRPSPHMGWNQLTEVRDSPLLRGIGEGTWMWFAHSYALPVDHYCIARCHYGRDFCAVAQQGNTFGVQFHPERSAAPGRRLLANFLDL